MRLYTFGLAACLTAPVPALADEEALLKKTFTYKAVGSLEIKADVYEGRGPAPRPVVISIHGGALIMGNRSQINDSLLHNLLRSGFTVVSVDYRLAPETKLPAITEDLQDAYRWVHDKGPALFNIDPERIAVIGGSAGGYLTLVAGYRCRPQPRALVSFWGYGDIAGHWYNRPDPFYSKLPAVTSEEAYKAVGGAALAGSSGRNNRGRFYLYCRQNGLWTKEVAGIYPDRDPAAIKPFCPIQNVSAQYPPTLLIHGTKDTDVPYAQSENMAKELGRVGVEHELVTVNGAGHGLAGATTAKKAEINDHVVEFIKKRLSN